jgi:tRNA dimethylallyltransferase
MQGKPKILAIVGPTASGKTALGIALAHKFAGEIVSADSRQIYRGMDIGTAKPTPAEMDGVPHHLIDIRDPNEDYSVTEYQRDAIAAINEVLSREKLPILVGGTGLYIKAVVENLAVPEVKADPALRAKIENEISHEGLEAVFKKLVARDPEAAYIVDPKNPRRVVRALEVAITTGAPFTAQRKKQPPLFDALTIGLNPPAEILRERIDARIDRMISDGLENEVRELTKKYGSAAPALNAIGYREIIDTMHGTLSLNEAIATVKLNTWHYAKRQMTWFRKDERVYWINSRQESFILAKKFMEY